MQYFDDNSYLMEDNIMKVIYQKFNIKQRELCLNNDPVIKRF